MSYSRFAIYYVPPVGALAEFGASWLGWYVLHGCETTKPDMPGLDDITMTPRKYGCHATLKPPFRQAEAQDVQALEAAASDLVVDLALAICEGLELTTSGGFLELTPQDDMQAVRRHLPDQPRLFVLDQIALCGEREDGRFEVIHRYKLTG